jgi:hypothetical protein
MGEAWCRTSFVRRNNQLYNPACGNTPLDLDAPRRVRPAFSDATPFSAVPARRCELMTVIAPTAVAVSSKRCSDPADVLRDEVAVPSYEQKEIA